jgi:hypothetical protein
MKENITFCRNDVKGGGVYIDISDLAVRLLFLFLPGIVSSSIIDLLTSHRKRQPFNFILHSYLLGVISYGLLILVVNINNKIVLQQNGIPSWKVTFLNSLLNNKEKIHVYEVFYASLIGFLVAIIITIIINHTAVYRLTNWLHISHKYGEGDVWDFMLNSNDVNWINIRENDLIYQGSVVSYSEKEGIRELLLSQVKVFQVEDENVELYEMPTMYFNFDISSNIIIEVMS